jgi:hypothetical protein
MAVWDDRIRTCDPLTPSRSLTVRHRVQLSIPDLRPPSQPPEVALVCWPCGWIWEPTEAEWGEADGVCPECGSWDVVAELINPQPLLEPLR